MQGIVWVLQMLGACGVNETTLDVTSSDSQVDGSASDVVLGASVVDGSASDVVLADSGVDQSASNVVLGASHISHLATRKFPHCLPVRKKLYSTFLCRLQMFCLTMG